MKAFVFVVVLLAYHLVLAQSVQNPSLDTFQRESEFALTEGKRINDYKWEANLKIDRDSAALSSRIVRNLLPLFFTPGKKILNKCTVENSWFDRSPVETETRLAVRIVRSSAESQPQYFTVYFSDISPINVLAVEGEVSVLGHSFGEFSYAQGTGDVTRASLIGIPLGQADRTRILCN